MLDASQGQNGLKQAKSFAKSANLSGAIITKLDGTSRGVSLAVSEEVNLPNNLLVQVKYKRFETL